MVSGAVLYPRTLVFDQTSLFRTSSARLFDAASLYLCTFCSPAGLAHLRGSCPVLYAKKKKKKSHGSYGLLSICCWRLFSQLFVTASLFISISMYVIRCISRV